MSSTEDLLCHRGVLWGGLVLPWHAPGWGSLAAQFLPLIWRFVPLQKHYFPINYVIGVPYEGVLRIDNVTRLVRTPPGLGASHLLRSSAGLSPEALWSWQVLLLARSLSPVPPAGPPLTQAQVCPMSTVDPCG